MTLGIAREGQEEQTFWGSTKKKKSWRSGQNETIFRRLRPLFVVAKASGSAMVSAGLALVSREYQWFSHGNTVRYESEGTRLRVDRSISATSTVNSVFQAWLAWIFFGPTIWKAGREEDMPGSVCSSKKLCDSADTFALSEGSASGDKRGISSTRNSTSTMRLFVHQR